MRKPGSSEANTVRLAILGAGNWGTTLAILLQRSGHEIVLWEFDAGQADLLARTRENKKFLPGYTLPDSVLVTSHLDTALAASQMWLLVVPVQTCRSVLQRIAKLPAETVIVSMMKGIERTSLYPVSEICAQELEGFAREQFAAISGPTIATEVAAGLPTSAVVASASRQTATQLQTAFSSRQLRLYTSEDVAGAELAGALKNVIALAAGMCDGLNLGYNVKGALLTRGLVEITRLGTALGGTRQTFSGLSGMGDLITTCTSPHSRNRAVGERIGRGEPLKDVLASLVMVAEGVWTARAALELAERHDVELPITRAVCRVLEDGRDPREAVADLMRRDLKPED